MTTTILVCDTCRYSTEEKVHDGKTGGEMLAEMVESLAGSDVRVRRHSCLMGCDHHCNVAVRAPGKLTYVMGRFDPVASSAEAVTAFARMHAASETGRVVFREWPEGVKGHFVARVPPIEEDLVNPGGA